MNYKKILKNKKLRFKILSLMKFIPDKAMLKIQYRVKNNQKLNLKNPRRYTEKLQWYKLYYRDPLMMKCADKYTVREHVKSKGLEHILNELYEVFEKPEDIDLTNLPDKFVLKLSNGSSTNLVCKDKTKLDIKKVKQKFKDFEAQRKSTAGREWVYANGKSVIVAEKFLEDLSNQNGEICDYKILCFDGKPEYTICVCGRHTENYHHVVYDAQWNKVDVRIGDSSAEAVYAKPDNFDEMMNIARILSEDFPAARIDLYSINGKIYFGEITFFPWSGYMKFTPDKFDFEVGEKFVLPERNN